MRFIFKLVITSSVVLFSSCQAGLSGLGSNQGPLQPPSNSQSQISPRTKGSTLTGIVVWPQEAAPLKDLRFKILANTPTQTWKTESDAQGQFRFENVEWPQTNTPWRMEAQSISNPNLIFKCLYQAPTASSESKPMEMTLTSTAMVALLDQARKMNSPVMSVSTERLTQSDSMPLIETLKNSMMPYLNTPLERPLEEMPEIKALLEQSVKKLETLPGLQP